MWSRTSLQQRESQYSKLVSQDRTLQYQPGSCIRTWNQLIVVIINVYREGGSPYRLVNLKVRIKEKSIFFATLFFCF